MRARSSRIVCRPAPVVVHVSLAFLLFVGLAWPSFSDAADQPASPAQLEALRGQIETLQASRDTKRGEMDAAGGFEILNIDAKIAALTALEYLPKIAKDAAVETYLIHNEDVTPENAPSAAAFFDSAQEKAKLERQREAAVKRREAERNRIESEIAGLDAQIAQLEASLDYWKDPLGRDLENERAGLRNLESQQPTKDDEGQLGRDIESRRQRIKELEDLERQFQQSQRGSQTTTSSQSVVPQGAYGTPSSGSGTSSGSSAQSPGHSGYGPGPYGGTGSSPFLTHQEILQGVQGSIGGEQPGMSKPGGG